MYYQQRSTKTVPVRHSPPCGIHITHSITPDFLYKTLPFVATVSLQDKIYWVIELPQHEVSRYLIQKFPGYHEWAANSRKRLEEQAETEAINEVMMLNGASQAAFNSVHHKMNVLGEKIDSLTNAFERNVYPLFRQQQVSNRSTQCRAGQPPQRPAQCPGPQPVGVAQSESNDSNRIETDQAATATPNTPKTLPKSLRTLVDQHLTLELLKYEHTQKENWPDATRIAYSRRVYLFSKVAENAGSLRTGEWAQKLKEAAMELDRTRVVSLPKYIKQLKEADVNFERRRKRANPDNDA